MFCREVGLESLEKNQNSFSVLAEVFKSSSGPIRASQIETSECDALMQRCERLEALNAELMEELDETRHEHAKEVEELCFTHSQLKSELEHSEESARNLQVILIALPLQN